VKEVLVASDLSTFILMGIPESDLERIRTAGRDDFGNPLSMSTVLPGGEGAPLRCCLKPADAGERIALIAFRPPSGRGAYSEIGPVFIHADPCVGYATPDRFPPAFADRVQVLRAYDREGRICDAVITAGGSADAAIGELLTRDGVANVECRNLLYGCFMCWARRMT
jgi:hypothetical protein